MALGRIRSIRTDVHSCLAIASLPDSAWRVLLGLYPLVDDEGRAPGDPAFVAGHIFWASHRDVSEVASAMRLLAERSLVQLYEVDGVRYLQIIGWRDDKSPTCQRIDRPQDSRLPAPGSANGSSIDSAISPTIGSTIDSAIGSTIDSDRNAKVIRVRNGMDHRNGDAAARLIAEAAVPAINEISGRTYTLDAKLTLKLCRKLAKEKLTPEQVRSAVIYIGSPWRGTKYEDGIRPKTLLDLDRVLAAVDDIAARAGSATRRLVPADAPRTIRFDDDESQGGAA